MSDDIIIDIARERLVSFLQARREMNGQPPTEIEFVTAIGDMTTENRIFCVFKFKMPESDKWCLGVSGGFMDEESKGDPENFVCPMAFSSFYECPDDRVQLISAAFIMAIFVIQRDNARDELFRWVTERGKLPSKVEYAFPINGKQSQNRRFFVFKLYYGEKILLGVSGGYETFEDKPDSVECMAAFSGFLEFPEDRDEAIDLAFRMAAVALNTTEFRWNDAYRANPHLYETEDGGLLVNFALTEDTDSIFPLAPEEHWAVEGKTINKWILSIVSITKDGVIGTIEYHKAIERLKEHFLVEKDGWALIEGLNLNELEELFEGLPRNAL
ncbi:MAG: DUF4299 domain-containing protein [Muribaculum sp.]|nr:DUF4299 domain-containing protein [Muribaculum sp.]